MTLRLPPTASVAEAREGDKLHAPAAARNAQALSELVAQHGAQNGRALEIASGTGQHVVAFARALTDVTWHPTDVDPARLRSIDAHVTEAGLVNVAPAAPLDATQAGWAGTLGRFDLIVLINLLHLISMDQARTVLAETTTALAPGGTFILYGPFARDGVLTSEGDVRFDAQLRGANPRIGYKDTSQINACLAQAGLSVTRVEMPANNLAFIARKDT